MEHLNDPTITAFILANSEWMRVRTDVLYNAYVGFCAQLGEEPRSMVAFGRSLKSVGIDKKQIMVNGVRNNFYLNRLNGQSV